MRYLIRSVNGTYYDEHEDAFGPRQAATEYAFLDDLPDRAAGLLAEHHGGDDVRWYRGDDQDAEASLCVTRED